MGALLPWFSSAYPSYYGVNKIAYYTLQITQMHNNWEQTSAKKGKFPLWIAHIKHENSVPLIRTKAEW